MIMLQEWYANNPNGLNAEIQACFPSMLVASRGTDLCSTKRNMISEEQADRKGSLSQA